MKLSTRARYALRFMIDLASASDGRIPVKLKDISRRQNISRRYLDQLAQSLKRANLLIVTCGRGGGYRLRRPADQIRVLDVIEATLGPINIVDCVLNQGVCSRSERCPSRMMWVELNRAIVRVLSEHTLADLVEWAPPLEEWTGVALPGACPDMSVSGDDDGSVGARAR